MHAVFQLFPHRRICHRWSMMECLGIVFIFGVISHWVNIPARLTKRERKKNSFVKREHFTIKDSMGQEDMPTWDPFQPPQCRYSTYGMIGSRLQPVSQLLQESHHHGVPCPGRGTHHQRERLHQHGRASFRRQRCSDVFSQHSSTNVLVQLVRVALRTPERKCSV